MRYSEVDLYTTSNRMKADLVLASRPEEVTKFLRRLADLLAVYDFGSRDVFAILLAVEEALVNAIRHGNGMDHSKSVHVTIALGRTKFRIRIRDEGAGFDPTRVLDPTVPENLEPGGRGLLLMRKYMHEVRHNRNGNAVTLIRQCSKES